jgi:hypothetical protein
LSLAFGPSAGLVVQLQDWVRFLSFGALVEGGETSIFHVHDPIRIFVDARIMGDDQDAAIFIEYFLLDESDDHPPGVTVQGGGRFVENQNLRTADDRARDGDALLLPAGKFDGQNLAPVFQSDDLKGLARFRNGFVPVALLQDQWNGDVLGGGQSREKMEVLEDETNRIEAEVS